MYTKVPNALIEAMPEMSNSVLAVCLAVCRKTLGYQREWEDLSIYQIMQLTGMSNRSVIDAIKVAVANGWMIRKRNGDSFQYKIVDAEKILQSEKSSHKNVATETESANFMCEENSQPSNGTSEKISLQEPPSEKISLENDAASEKFSPTNIKKTLTNVSVAAAPQPKPLATQFHDLEAELKTVANKAAKLVEIYILLYGQETAPAFGYMLKVANQIGGAGYMAHRLWELSARPPNGDILAYLLAEYRGKQQRQTYTNGTPPAPAKTPDQWKQMFDEQDKDEPDYLKRMRDGGK